MFIRVDDYPSGSPLCTVQPGYAEALAGFKDAVQGAPFCLGVVFGFLAPEEIETIRKDPQIHIAAHGWTHSIGDTERPETLAAMRAALGAVRPAILIPPKNIVEKPELVTQYFDRVLIGPHQKRIEDPRFIWPWHYGWARELRSASVEPPAGGVLALHLTWEAPDGFAALRELIPRLPPIQPWSDLR